MVIPSLILSVIYKKDVPVPNSDDTLSGFFAMMRKGPIWEEVYDSDKFTPANPDAPDNLKWWSEPMPLNNARARYGVLFYRGPKQVNKLNGEYFANE